MRHLAGLFETLPTNTRRSKKGSWKSKGVSQEGINSNNRCQGARRYLERWPIRVHMQNIYPLTECDTASTEAVETNQTPLRRRWRPFQITY